MIYGFFDTETTGLKQEEGHRLIEVALQLRDDAGKVLGSYVTRINPQRGIDPKAQEVHGISFEDLIGEPLWEDVAPKLSLLLSKCDYVVAHNGEGFDLPFVVRELIRVGVSVPPIRSIDTMLGGRWATPDGSVPNLGALAWACDVPYDKSKAHAALYDVEVMADCFYKARAYFAIPSHFFELPKGKEATK